MSKVLEGINRQINEALNSKVKYLNYHSICKEIDKNGNVRTILSRDDKLFLDEVDNLLEYLYGLRTKLLKNEQDNRTIG